MLRRSERGDGATQPEAARGLRRSPEVWAVVDVQPIPTRSSNFTGGATTVKENPHELQGVVNATNARIEDLGQQARQ